MSVNACTHFSYKLAVKAPTQPVVNAAIRLLFYYTSSTSGARVYRRQISLTCTPIVEASVDVLDATDGLCSLNVRNMISTRDSFLAQIECLRLLPALRAPADIGLTLTRLSTRAGM